MTESEYAAGHVKLIQLLEKEVARFDADQDLASLDRVGSTCVMTMEFLAAAHDATSGEQQERIDRHGLKVSGILVKCMAIRHAMCEAQAEKERNSPKNMQVTIH